jgi:hypothetical protein
MPITEEDKASEHFYPGVSCPHCIDKTTEQQRLRFAERHKQIELARCRGEDHIGSIKIEKRELDYSSLQVDQGSSFLTYSVLQSVQLTFNSLFDPFTDSV